MGAPPVSEEGERSTRRPIATPILTLFALSGCAPGYEEILAGRSSQAWRVVEAWYIDSEGVHHDISESCRLDNEFVFYADGTYARDENTLCDDQHGWLVPTMDGTWAVDEYGAMTTRAGESVFFYDVHFEPQQVVFDANLAQLGAEGVYREVHQAVHGGLDASP